MTESRPNCIEHQDQKADFSVKPYSTALSHTDASTALFPGCVASAVAFGAAAAASLRLVRPNITLLSGASAVLRCPRDLIVKMVFREPVGFVSRMVTDIRVLAAFYSPPLTVLRIGRPQFRLVSDFRLLPIKVTRRWGN